jgi:hypothetical protein
MSTQSLLWIITYFVTGWILGGFAFVTPQLIKSVRERRVRRPGANDPAR